MARFAWAAKMIAIAIIGLLSMGPALATESNKPTIADYGALPDLELAAISPTGSRVAMVANVSGARALLVMEGGKLVNKIALGDVKVRDLAWGDDNYVALELSQTELLTGFTVDKAEFYKTLIIPAYPGKANMVFTGQPRLANATFGWYGFRQIDGKSFGYFGAVENVEVGSGVATRIKSYEYRGGPADLYRVDLANMKAEKVARSYETKYTDWIVDEKGAVAASLVFDYDKGNWTIRNASGTTIATGTNSGGGIALRALGPDGATLFYSREDEATGDREYYEVPLAGGAAQLRFADVDVRRLLIDPRTGRLLGYLIDDDSGSAFFYDKTYLTRFNKIKAAFPKLNRSLLNWNVGFDQVVVGTNGNGDSGTYWHVNLASLRAETLGYERPNIGPEAVGPISSFRYIAADGLDIDAILTLPPGREPKNLPVIILPHGGPSSHDQVEFNWWAQALAARGYAVVQPNFRGSTNRDGAFMRAGHGEWGRKMQTDLSDGLAHLATQGIVDPRRACIVGASYGGYAALAGVTLQQGIYRCAVSVAGVSDLFALVRSETRESGGNKLLKRVLQAEIGKGRDLQAVSPIRFAEKADAPILLIHGKDDVVVPFSQSSRMADALKDAGKNFEFIALKGEDHWLSVSDTRQQMLAATVAFLEKHNPPQ